MLSVQLTHIQADVTQLDSADADKQMIIEKHIWNKTVLKPDWSQKPKRQIPLRKMQIDCGPTSNHMSLCCVSQQK